MCLCCLFTILPMTLSANWTLYKKLASASFHGYQSSKPTQLSVSTCIVVLHTDAAKSYKPKMSGVLHDHVRHCKKRVKVKGKWMWKLPTYVRVTTHKDPKTGRKFKTKGGTQIIDRAWRFLKDRIHLNQHCRVGTPLLRAKIRSAQYEYWRRNADLWLQTGIVCTWHVAKSLA